MKLLGKAVVVTGASSGMGRDIVKKFAMEGANVIAVARRVERLDELVSELKDAPGKVIAFGGDVSKTSDNEGMINACVENFGKIDILVCNAGVMDDMATVANYSDDKLDYVFRINFVGVLEAMKIAVNKFLSQGNGGNIIVTSSIGASHQAAGAVYCASKAAVNAVVRHTAFCYRGEKIRCNAIAPGGIMTEISTSMGIPNMDGFGRIKGI